MATTDETVAENMARHLEGRVFRLSQERDELVQANARIAAIDAEIVILQQEIARIADRRPPRAVIGEAR